MSFIARRFFATNMSKSPGLLHVFDANPKRRDRIKYLAKLFQEAGFELRIAGGAVRDIIQGVEPDDIDFATDARPEQSLEIVQKQEDRFRVILTAAGLKHGTVKVKFKEINDNVKRLKPEYDDENPYDITTLRSDVVTDGRHAEVEFINDWALDAERRDLTINAMFLTLDSGELVDFFGGESDLKEGIVRFVGQADQRIQEDHLRILRYFRFWSRYGRHRRPDDDTLNSIRKNLPGLRSISGERLWLEVRKIFARMPCVEVIKLMMELDVFTYLSIDSDSPISLNTDRAIRDLEDVSSHVDRYLKDQTLYSKETTDAIVAVMFATVVEDEQMCMNFQMRMKFSNIDRYSLLYIVLNRHSDPNIEDLKQQLVLAPGSERRIVTNKIRALLLYKGRLDILSVLDNWTVPEFPLEGNVIAREVRLKGLPGNKIKTVIESLKSDWASRGYTTTKEGLMSLMHEKLDDLKKEISK